MSWIFRHRKEILIIGFLAVLYFVLRVPNLTLQPIFADEAIYIRWAQVMRAEPTLRFLPLSDGKTPLFMWSMMPVLKFIQDPLFAGRFLSILSGFATFFGVIVLGWKVFGKNAAIWAGLLYTITPYTVFFDRMALVDSMLSTFTIWSVYLAIWLAQSVRLDLAMILGFILGGGILTKTPGMIELLLLPTSILAFKRVKQDKYRLIKLIFLWGVAILIALLMYNLLRLGPNFQLLSSRNADYVFTPVELIGRPLDPFIPHFRDISDWFPKLFSWPILIIGAIGIIWVIWKKNKGGIIILLWVIIPLFLSMAFLRTYTARYLLPSISPLLVLGGFGLERILKKVDLSNFLKVLFSLAIISPLALFFNYQLITNPPPDWLPKEERIGYFEAWTSGYGFSEIAKFLLEKNRLESVVVGTEGFFGTLPDGLQIYLDKSNIAVVKSSATISAQVKMAAKDHPTFFVGDKSRLSKNLERTILIKEYLKAKPLDGSEQNAILLYQVLP